MKQLLYCTALAIALVAVPLDDTHALQEPKAETSAQADGVKEKAPTPWETALKGAEKIGDGMVTAYKKGDSFLLALPNGVEDRLLLWYAEAVSLPAAAVSAHGIQIGTTVVSLERHGNRVLVRDHTAGYSKRTGQIKSERPGYNKPNFQSIQMAVNDAAKGPIIAVFPLVAESGEGRLLIDITQQFSKDIERLTARIQISGTGKMPTVVDPTRSYISDIKVFSDDVDIRSHLTFLVTDKNDPISGPQPLSIEIGHSIVLLPKQPMQPRLFDQRVGFFQDDYVEYETVEGKAVDKRSLIVRWRLEKSDPAAKVSDPVKPITFYIGRGVPDRWRSSIKAGVEQWQPVLEAAGFSNAIVALDAPSLEEDPAWSPEDARHSVIRWIAQAKANAQGPHIRDPRSGEILAAHIQIWPEVLGTFERYYYSVASSLDPEAAILPMSEKKQGELLQYIVAHEVGHTLGLRHNHLASTAYSVAQLRDPEFANKHGANSSLMAYGRFNQAAQPGDGVTQILPIIGPYDYFAIDWGYGIHATDPNEEQKILDQMAAKADSDRNLMWAAGEAPWEKEKWSLDPRVQMENTGAERVEATRLVLANLRRSLEGLDAATNGNDDLFAQTCNDMTTRQLSFLNSVQSVVGGRITRPGSERGARYDFIPAADQRDAVRFLLSEGAQSMDIYKKQDVISRALPIGGIWTIEKYQALLLQGLLTGSRLTILDSQKVMDPTAYGVVEFADDMLAILWNDLETTPRYRRVLQKTFLEQVDTILHPEKQSKENTAKMAAMMQDGYSASYAGLANSNGADTLFPAWTRATLPELKTKLEAAAKSSSDQTDRLHLEAMAVRIERLLK